MLGFLIGGKRRGFTDGRYFLSSPQTPEGDSIIPMIDPSLARV